MRAPAGIPVVKDIALDLQPGRAAKASRKATHGKGP